MSEDTAATPVTPSRVQSSKVWLSDGNVVLEAQGTMFRVLRSILSRESVVFHDMFLMPQPALEDRNADMYDGCPLVHLEDSADDISLFLSVLFDMNALDEECKVRDHIILLDIATKYQAPRLLRRIMLILVHHFPNTLAGHDHRMEERLANKYKCSAVSRTCSPTLNRSEVCLLLAVARRTNMQILLPYAYFCGASLSVENLFLGRSQDGLSEEDTLLILSGQRQLRQLARDVVYTHLFAGKRDISLTCNTSQGCYEARDAIIRTKIESPETHGAFLKPFVSLGFNSEPIKGLCGACKSTFKTSYLAGREEAWEKLPRVFGLPDWVELRESFVESMQ